jgi:hypothetical protein
MQNSQESPRFWGLHMKGKSLHMADFGLLGRFFGLHRVYISNAVKLSKKNVEINLSKILHALKFFCGPVLETPCGGGAGLGRDRPRADPAARWRTLVRGAGPAGSVGGRRPVMRGSLATGPGYRRWDSDGGPRLEARSLGRWTCWLEEAVGRRPSREGPVSQAGVLTAREPPASQQGTDGL